MKDFYNFLTELASSINDRLKFPVFNAFLISWAVLNWQAIFIILFSSQSIEARINTINQEYNDIWINLFCPILLAVAYTIATPWVKKGLFWMLSDVNKNNRDEDIKYVISSYVEKINLAREEVKLEVERAKHLELKELNDVVDKLKAELESERLEKEKLRKEIIEKDKNIEKIEKKYSHSLDRSLEQGSHYQLRAKDLEELLDQFFAFTQKVTTQEYQDESSKGRFFRTYLGDIELLINEYHRLKSLE